MRNLRKDRSNAHKAQSLIELAVLIVCVTAALLAMHFYIKRGMEGRLKGASDYISEEHYQTDSVESDITTETESTTKVTQNEVLATDKSGNPVIKNKMQLVGFETTVDSTEDVEKKGHETLQ